MMSRALLSRQIWSSALQTWNGGGSWSSPVPQVRPRSKTEAAWLSSAAIGSVTRRSSVHCETEAISTAVDTLLTHHSCRRPSALPGDVVEVGLCQAREARADRLYPPGVPLFQYDVACGYCQGSGLLVSDGYSSLAVHPERGVQGSVAPRSREDGYLFAVITFNLALQLALRERGLYYVHAAALAGPRERCCWLALRGLARQP
jgi:hypothetical protein